MEDKGQARNKSYIYIHTYIYSHRLEKTSKIESNHPHSTTIPAKSYPEVPHLHLFKSL